MSRTYAHTPYHVHARRDPNAHVVHRGCQHDPSGEGRLVGYRIDEVTEAADWRPRVLGVQAWFDPHPTWYTYDPATQFYLRDGATEPEPLPQRREVFAQHGAKLIYAPAKFLTQVPVFEVVNCDVDDEDAPRGCFRQSDQASDLAFGYRHKCDWSGMRRELWYSPERQQGREFCRQAAAEYNTTGEAPDDEPYVPSSPSGLWGGGWVD